MVSQDVKEFGLAYSGEALTENTMEVRDLAPSLLAFGELFTRANQILNGENTSVSLKVRATQPGSFELILILAQVYLQTTHFLTGDFVTSASNLVDIIAGSTGLFNLFRKLRGQKPDVVSPQPGGVVLKARDIEVFVPTEVFRVYQDNETRRLSQVVVAPLYRIGIDAMTIKDGDKLLETVSKEDASSFTASDIPVGDAIENIIPSVRLRLISPTFDLKRTKWKLDDGSGGNKWYGIEDEKFLREVREHRRRFGMGDYLICRVKTVQRLKENKLEMERTILLVMEHRVDGEQLSFGSS